MSMFFQHQIDYVYFFSGLGFTSITATCINLRRSGNKTLPWSYLGLSAGINGLNDWLGLFAYSTTGIDSVVAARVSIMAVAFFLLIEFGRMGLKYLDKPYPGIWIYIPFIIITILGYINGWTGVDTISRYALGFTGTLWTAYIFMLAAGISKDKSEISLRICGLSFSICAIACLVSAYPVNIYPANVLNREWFHIIFGFPIQIVQGVLTLVATISLWQYFLLSNSSLLSPEDAVSRKKIANWTAISLLVIIVLGWKLTTIASNLADNAFRQNLLLEVETSASLFDANDIAQLTGTPNDLNTPQYKKLRKKLLSILMTNQDYRFIYIMGYRNSKIKFLVDTEPKSSRVFSMENDIYGKIDGKLINAMQKGDYYVYGPNKDAWGTWVSGISSIKTPDNKVVGIIGIDIDAKNWMAVLITHRLFCIVTTLLLCLLLMTYFVILQGAKEFTGRIRRSENRYRGLVEVSPNWVALIDNNGVFITTNQTSLSIMGWKTGDIIGRRIIDLAPEEAKNIVNKSMEQVLSGKCCTYDLILNRADRSQVNWHITINPIKDDDNNIHNLVWVANDVTDIRAAEQALKESRNMLSTLMSNLPGMVYRCNNDDYWTMDFVSDGSLELTGYSQSDLINNNKISYEELIHQNDKGYVREKIENAIFTNSPFQLTYRITTASGDEKWVYEHGHVLNIQDSGRITLEGLITDITDRKRIEDSLKHRLAYENMLSDISFRAVTLTDISKFRDECLEIIGKTLDINYAYLYEYYPDAMLVENTACWYSPDTSIEDKCRQIIDINGNTDWVKILSANRILKDEEINESVPDLLSLLKHTDNSRSIMLVPLVQHGKWYGFLRLDECRHKHHWPDEDIDLLKTTSRIITGVIESNRSEEALKTSEANYRTIFDTANDAIFIFDAETGDIIDVNQQMTKIFGYTRDEVLSLTLDDLSWSDSKDSITDNIAEITSAHTPQIREWIVRSKIDKKFWVEANLKHVTINDRSCILAILRDITERKESEARLRMQISAINAATDQIMITDPEGNILFVNPAFEDETGYQFNEVVGRNIVFVKIGYNHNDLMSGLIRALRSGSNWHGEVVTRRKNNTMYAEDITITPVKNESGKIENFIAINRNVTEKKVYEQKLNHLAHHDPLTGLPNRLLFIDRLSQRLIQAHRRGQVLAVMFLDLDRFKYINDTRGHSEGDKLLKSVAKRLTSCLREADTVARMGGDEFTIIISDISRPEDASIVAQKILAALSKPFTLNGEEMFISVSIGISLYPSDGIDVETMVKNADTAMYRAKDNGRNNYQFYTDELNTAVMERMMLENSLRKAIDRNELILHYQPVLDMETGLVNSMEALVRWQHPDMGLLHPAQFIPLADETGLIVQIGEWVINAVCQQAKAWHDSGLPVHVSINISERQFEHISFIASVRNALSSSGLDSRYLGLEVNENTLTHDTGLTETNLRLLNELNAGVIIDNFSIGQASLNYLRNFKIRMIKIDKSLVKDITCDQDDLAITDAMIAIAHSLKLRVVAEGVETEEQIRVLKSLQCDCIQGYIVSQPLPPEQFETGKMGIRSREMASIDNIVYDERSN